MAQLGGWQVKTISNSSSPARQRWLMLALVFGAGVLAVAMHEVLRWPLKLPGRHGLELMALLMFARCASSERYAATLAALGGSLTVNLLHPGHGVESVILLLQGITIDAVYRRIQAWPWWTLGLLAAAAHALKPLVKLLFLESWGVPAGSLVNGLGYPLLTHLVFGGLGGLFGVLAWQGIRRARAQSGS